MLADDGVALIHTIGRSEPPTATNPFIAKYIFPGGYIPALSEMVAAIERSGLIIADVEILRLHYAETLRPGASGSSPTGTRPPPFCDETLLPDVGVLSRGLARRPSATRTSSCSSAADQADRGPADHARLHVQTSERRLMAGEAGVPARTRMAGEYDVADSQLKRFWPHVHN